MTTKHTPGKWKTRIGFLRDTIEVFAQNPKIKKPFRPTALAVVESDTSEGKANARLISAAPDGYEFAQAFMGRGETGITLEELGRMAEKFIAKAKGETQ